MSIEDKMAGFQAAAELDLSPPAPPHNEPVLSTYDILWIVQHALDTQWDRRVEVDGGRRAVSLDIPLVTLPDMNRVGLTLQVTIERRNATMDRRAGQPALSPIVRRRQINRRYLDR
jgi:hypothetical protein